MPEFSCKLTEATTALAHSWEHTVGSGHALLALRADWQAQLRRCHHELGFRYVRFHGLLSDDIGTLVDHGGELQVEQLQTASRVAREPHTWTYKDRVVQIEIELPPHTVAAITLEFDCQQSQAARET